MKKKIKFDDLKVGMKVKNTNGEVYEISSVDFRRRVATVKIVHNRWAYVEKNLITKFELID